MSIWKPVHEFSIKTFRLLSQARSSIAERMQGSKTVIPVGAHCHPAFFLRSLAIREFSLPFDWLSNCPARTLDYVSENWKDRFRHFASDLAVSEQGHVFARKYPYAKFLHEPDLVENSETQMKFRERIRKFQLIVETRPCDFLFCIPSSALNTSEAVSAMTESCGRFSTMMKETDRLLIYILYDESLGENATYCQDFTNRTTNLNIVVVDYIRQNERYGIWGNDEDYPQLAASLGLAGF